MRLALMIGLPVVAVLIGLGVYLYQPDKSRASLEAAYFAPGDAYVDAAGARLHVRDTGPRGAPVVIMLHGFGSSLHTWEDWARDLDPALRVIRYDLPGFGLTGADPTGDYSDDRSVAVLAALMDALGVTRASLVGNSMGGRLAWEFAASRPARVDKLVLVSPDGFASPGFEYGRRPAVPAMMKVLPYTLPTMLLRMSTAPAYGDPARLTAATVARYRDMLLAPGVRRAILDRTAQDVRQDPRARLASIRAPVLLVWGERDAMIPFVNATDYKLALADSTLVSFPALGHVPFEEDPADTVSVVRAFLQP